MLRRLWLRFWRAYFRKLDRAIKARAALPPGFIWHKDVFPWLAQLEAAIPKINEELARYLDRGGIMPDKEDLAAGRTRQYGLDRWEFLHLLVYDEEIRPVCDRFPATLQILKTKVPGCCSAMFSRLPQKSRRILKHSDGENGTLRAHVSLIIPSTGTCFMRIGGVDVHWRKGEAFALDATVEHEVFKESEEERIILILDFLPRAPFWLRLLCQRLYPTIIGDSARKIMRESYGRLMPQR